MLKNITTFLNHDKDKHLGTQMQVFYNYLQTHTATASMVAEATGIKQKCLTRYKRTLEKSNLLWQVCERKCKVTGFKAYYLTTNPAKAPANYQLELF